ncbi:MAG: ABC transporter permease [Thermoplasmata archaeon]|nr:ABC transporter permease [Thermoplasmata archaeon]
MRDPATEESALGSNAPLDEKSPTPVAGPRRHPQLDQLKRTWYFLRKNTLAMVGLSIILIFVVVALASFGYPAPGAKMTLYCGTYPTPANNCAQVCTYAPPSPAPPGTCYAVSALQKSLVPPTISFSPLSLGPLPLGSLAPDPSTGLFYNIADGLIKGAPWSLGISVSIVGSGALIGLLLGAIAGLKGGYFDEAVMRFTDIFLSIPGLLLVLVLLAVLSASLGNSLSFLGRIAILVGAFVVTWWPFYTRIVRGQVLVTREQSYVEAARASGASNSRLLLKHIIPNSMYPVFVQMSLDVGTVPLLLGVIIFLGFPIWPSSPFPEWGTISALSVQNIENLVLVCAGVQGATCYFPWWQILFPGLTVFLFAISVNFLSDGIRDALDPRLRR